MAGSARAGRIKIDIVAGVADFNSDVDKATRKLGELGTHGVSGVQAVSGALRVLEGNLTNNLRAAENFIAKTLGLGEVLKAAFPVVGAIALGGVLSELVKRAGEAYEGFVKLQEAPKRISQSFQDITAPLRVANDQLAVTNDRLENQIAKLEGRRQNSLKLMLDEARLSADTLAEASNRDLKEVQKLLETEQIGAFKGFFTNIASTTGLTDQFKKFREQMNDLNIQTADKIAGTSDKKQQTDIYEDATNRRKALIDSETARLREQLGVVEKLQAERDNPNPGRVIGVTAGVPIFERGKPTGPNQAANIATLKEEIANLQSLSANISLTQTSAALNARKNALDTAKQNAGLQKPYDDRVSSMAAALEAAQARAKAPDVNTFAGALAAGFAEATKAIEETNKALAEHHQHLTLDQRLTLTSLATQTALTELSGRAAQKQKDLQKELEAGAQTVAVHMQLEVEALNARLEQLQARIDEIRAATKEANVGPAAAFQARYSTMPSETPEDQKKKELALAEYQNRVAVTTAELQRQTSMLWKMDTQAQETGQMAGTLADALVKMRAQVKESTDTGAKTATATNTIAREAVKQAAATTQLVQQVAAQPEPVVNVEVPKGTPSPVVVQTAPAPAAHPAPAPLAHYPVEHHTRSRWHWLRLLWPLGKDAERAQQ